MAPINPVNRWYGNCMKTISNFKLYSFNWLLNWGFMFSTGSESHQQDLERLNTNLASTMTCNVTVNRCVYIVCEHMQFIWVLHNDLSNALENSCACVCVRETLQDLQESHRAWQKPPEEYYKKMLTIRHPPTVSVSTCRLPAAFDVLGHAMLFAFGLQLCLHCWRYQPIWKNMRQIGSSPLSKGEIYHIWNHYTDIPYI